MPVKVTAGRLSTDTNPVQLVTYYENAAAVTAVGAHSVIGSANGGWYHGFYDQNGQNLTLVHVGATAQQISAAGITMPTTFADYQIVQVDIEAPEDATYTAGQYATNAPAGTYAYWDSTSNTTWTQSQIIAALAGTTVKIKAETDTSNSALARARFFNVVVDSALSISALPSSAGSTSVTSEDQTLPASNASPWKLTRYFGMYVDGVGSDTAAFTAGVKVSVAKAF